jgi:predicted enzyme related to lactoylglutathione lyase
MAFYTGLLGWDYAPGLPGNGSHIVATLRGQPVAGLGMWPPEQEGAPATWTTHLAVPDLDAALGQVGELGGQVFAGPTKLGDAARTGSVADAEGAVFGLWEAHDAAGTDIADEPGAFVWAEVWSGDQDAAARFYAGLLGLPDLPVVEGMRVVEVGGRPVFGIWPARLAVGVEGTGAHWLAYVRVAGTDAVAARAVELGGAVHGDPDDSPFGRWSLLADPQGARFAVVDTTVTGL